MRWAAFERAVFDIRHSAFGRTTFGVRKNGIRHSEERRSTFVRTAFGVRHSAFGRIGGFHPPAPSVALPGLTLTNHSVSPALPRRAGGASPPLAALEQPANQPSRQASPNAECRTPMADGRWPNANADGRTPNAERRSPIADRRMPNAECRMPMADGRSPNPHPSRHQFNPRIPQRRPLIRRAITAVATDQRQKPVLRRQHDIKPGRCVIRGRHHRALSQLAIDQHDE